MAALKPDEKTGADARDETKPGGADSNIQRWREAADKLRTRVDVTAKALGGIGTTAATAVGISRIGDLFPVPPGWVSWLWFSLALAGFAGLASAILIVTFRLWSVNKPIFMRTDPDAMKSQGDVDERERDAIRLVYQQMADLNRVPSLSAYEARAHRLARVAERTGDEAERKRLEAKSAEIGADIQATFALAALRVIRKRTSNAVRGAGSIVAYVLLFGGLVLFALGTDYVASERTEQVSIAKSCADARKAGATADTLPAICGEDTVADEPEGTSPEPGGGASAWAITERDLAGFRRTAEVHTVALRKPLCLVSFFDSKSGAQRTSKWWTSCRYARRRLQTIADIRELLALPASWGARDGRVFARIPAGVEVAYLKGTAAAQCAETEARCYHGGGEQYRVLHLDGRWLGEPQCVRTKTEMARAAWGPCDKR